MAIVRQTIVHEGPGGTFESAIAYDDAAEQAGPGVLILPNVLGRKEFDDRKAEALAGLGYVGLAVDLFGQGKRPGPDNRTEYMDMLNVDRPLLRDRLHAALALLKAAPQVDSARTAAIGFCFGGKCALDLARSGADLLGVVSFHGVYDRPPYDNVTPIRPKVLVLHGWRDPIAPPDAMVALGEELSRGGADWQIHAYGEAGHAFADPAANAPERGVAYEPKADRRSWRAMEDFLAEIMAA
jgi:dienelactone hydrolase